MSGKARMDTKLDIVLSVVLRLGLTLSIASILYGGCLYFINNGTIGIEERVFNGVPASFDGLEQLLKSSWKGDGASWIKLGLILLVATPVVRVAFCAVIFLLEKDMFYVGASCLVLALLLYSLI